MSEGIDYSANEFWVDGGCRGNGKENPVAYGSCSDGKYVETYQWNQLKTSNEAEYKTLISLLENLPESSIARINTDSRLVYGHLVLGWKMKAPNLRPFVGHARTLLKNHPNVTLEWVERDEIYARLGH